MHFLLWNTALRTEPRCPRGQVPRTLAWCLVVSLGFCTMEWCAMLPAAEKSPYVWTPERMIEVARIGVVQVSPDGQQAVFTVRRPVLAPGKSEYLTHLYLARIEERAASERTSEGNLPQSRPLTQGAASCDDPQWSPDGRLIAFLSSREGRKNLWIIRADGGEAWQATHLKSDVTSFRISPDGRQVAFTALDPATAEDEQRQRDKADIRLVDQQIKRSRLYVLPVPQVGEPPATELLPLSPADRSVLFDTARPGRAQLDWSPDGKNIAFAHASTPHADDWTTADISVLNVLTGKVRALATTTAVESQPCYSPDGMLIAYIRSDVPPTWAGRRRLVVVPANGSTDPEVWPDTQDGFGRYSELVGWSADGDSLYYTELQGTQLALLALSRSGSPQVVCQLPGMSASGVCLNSNRTWFGLSWESLSHPAEAQVLPVHATPANSLRPISRINADHAALDAPRTEIIRWSSKDGLEVEGLLTYPVGYRQGARVPLLVVVHGGPMGAFTQQYDGLPGNYPIAAFAERGFALLRPNIRGSSGYGQHFRYANYGDWGGGDFQDLMQGVDHAIGLGLADPERLGIMGWSYGGYMTSWTITQTRRFRAASVGAGVTNLVSFTGTADIPGFLPDYFGTEFWTNLEPYRRHSPMFHVQGVTTPTLIQHGERDERVPLSQGQELYNALRRQGCTVEMVVYPRTPHGIEEPRLLVDCMQRNLDWFSRYLLPSSTRATTDSTAGSAPAGTSQAPRR